MYYKYRFPHYNLLRLEDKYSHFCQCKMARLSDMIPANRGVIVSFHTFCEVLWKSDFWKCVFLKLPQNFGILTSVSSFKFFPSVSCTWLRLWAHFFPYDYCCGTLESPADTAAVFQLCGECTEYISDTPLWQSLHTTQRGLCSLKQWGIHSHSAFHQPAPKASKRKQYPLASHARTLIILVD